jgi:hypothetical protein
MPFTFLKLPSFLLRYCYSFEYSNSFRAASLYTSVKIEARGDKREERDDKLWGDRSISPDGKEDRVDIIKSIYFLKSSLRA